jgi:hypothetical protein
MKTVRASGKQILAVVLSMLMLGVFGVAATAHADQPVCKKNLGRGQGYAVVIHVTLAGKPVAGARVEIDTIHSVPVTATKTDSTGVANVKLSPGDYIVSASTKGASGMVTTTVTATTPVTVIVTLAPTPTTQP